MVAVSDIGGAAYNGNGLDVAALMRNRADGAQTIAEAGPGVELMSNAELLALDADVLIPAALDGVITEANATEYAQSSWWRVRTAPTTPDADAILAERGITVVPDILANSGGVAVSYFEWVQDLQAYFWEEPEVNEKLSRVMHRAYDEVTGVAAERGVTLRAAAQIIGVGRVVEATKVRGIYP